MEFIPDDWPLLARIFTGAFYGAFATLIMLALVYLLARYLVLGPPAPLEHLYALAFGGARTVVGAHALSRAYARAREQERAGTRSYVDTELLPVIPRWHEFVSKT